MLYKLVNEPAKEMSRVVVACLTFAVTLPTKIFVFADAANGAFVFLGIANTKLGTDQLLHTPRFQMDESMLPVGAAMHASVATTFLQQQYKHFMKQQQHKSEL